VVVVVEDRSSDEYNPHPLQAAWDGYPFLQSDHPKNQIVHQHKCEDIKSSRSYGIIKTSKAKSLLLQSQSLCFYSVGITSCTGCQL